MGAGLGRNDLQKSAPFLFALVMVQCLHGESRRAIPKSRTTVILLVADG
jgi:hypothetical protein